MFITLGHAPVHRVDFMYFSARRVVWQERSIEKQAKRFFRNAVVTGTLGHTTINILPIHKYVSAAVDKIPDRQRDNSLLSIAESAEHVWKTLSKNMKGVVHNWMLKGKTEGRPIFKPHEYVTRPSRAGCRLSISDQVTIGLLYALFAFGVGYSAFTSPLRFQKHYSPPGE